jgi:hypothetical protein
MLCECKLPGAGCIKKLLKLTMIKCKRHPIRSAYLRVLKSLFNYKIVIKKVIKSFIQPAPEEYDNMILCDLCGQWFHFRCLEYDTSLSISNEWLCRLCPPPVAKKPKMCM